MLFRSDFDRLEETIPVRARPAIGDDDGRLVTLHLLPASKMAPTVVPKQPRGLKRYLADWVRSPAEPVVRLLASWLLLHSPKKIE